MYRKQRLVPFGEYIPPWIRFLAPLWNSNFAFTPAPAPQQPIPLWGGMSFAPLVCFEVTYPGFSNSMVREGANFLVNVTDDGWFTGTMVPMLQLNLGRMRAVETRRWLVSASNSGPSVVIDLTGETRGMLPFGSAGALRESIGVRRDLSPYVKLGEWIVWGSWVIVGSAIVRRVLRWKRPSRAPIL